MKRIGWVPAYVDENNKIWPWVEQSERWRILIKDRLKKGKDEGPGYLKATYKNIKIIPVYIDENKLRGK